jgi:hypothetical protein
MSVTTAVRRWRYLGLESPELVAAPAVSQHMAADTLVGEIRVRPPSAHAHRHSVRQLARFG